MNTEIDISTPPQASFDPNQSPPVQALTTPIKTMSNAKVTFIIPIRVLIGFCGTILIFRKPK